MSKTRIFTAFAAVALSAAGSAPAFAKTQDNQGNGSAGAGASAEDRGERKLCKRFENTASRMRSEKVCLTKSEWKKWDQN
jgi:hypothetical protein